MKRINILLLLDIIVCSAMFLLLVSCVKAGNSFYFDYGDIYSGNECVQKQEYECAIVNYSKFIEESYRCRAAKGIYCIDKFYLAQVFNNRANSFYGVNDLNQALDDANKSINLSNEYKFAYLTRGNIHAAMGNNAEALFDYNIATKIDSEFAAAYANKARVYVNQNNYDEAISSLQKALSIRHNADDAQLYVELIDYGRKNKIITKENKFKYPE